MPYNGKPFNTKMIPCKFYMDNRCTFGDNCRYLHLKMKTNKIGQRVPVNKFNGVTHQIVGDCKGTEYVQTRNLLNGVCYYVPSGIPGAVNGKPSMNIKNNSDYFNQGKYQIKQAAKTTDLGNVNKNILSTEFRKKITMTSMADNDVKGSKSSCSDITDDEVESYLLERKSSMQLMKDNVATVKKNESLNVATN